jgi:ATP-dependent Clp protease ATP-binding subunit ClpC
MFDRMDRFDKFTDRARKVLTLAQDEAQRFNHNYIGTEHLLLGLVREGEGVAARVLENMNVELPKVRTAVEFIIGRGDRPVVGEVGLTPREARDRRQSTRRAVSATTISTEHRLLGLVREGRASQPASRIPRREFDKVRHEVIRVRRSPRVGPAQRRSGRKTPTVDALINSRTRSRRQADPVIGREIAGHQILGRRENNRPHR